MLDGLKQYYKRTKSESAEIRSYFDKCAYDIDMANMYILRKVCMYAAIVLVCMLIFLLVLTSSLMVTSGHYLLTGVIAFYFCVNLYCRRRNYISKFWVSVTCLAFYFWLSVSFILMEIFGRGEFHTHWLITVIMAFPILFIDRFFKYQLEELAILIVYVCMKYAFHDTANIVADFYKVFTACILSLVVSRMLLVLRSKQGLSMVELRRYSSLDKLTRVYNKSALLQEIDTSLFTRQQGIPCSMSIIDMDNFKQVNDNLGHSGGDMVLEHIGDLLLKNFRATDIIGRFGGDEFVVFIPNIQDPGLIELRCRSLQMQLTDYQIGNSDPFSLSIGTIIDYGSHSRDELFTLADDALYKSKMMGKNCCTSWTTHDEEDLQKAFMIMIARSKEDVRKQIRKIEDRFDILCTETDDEAIQYISQYRDKISLVVAELDTGSNTGTFAPRYIKTRERFKDIPVLIIVEKPEEKESAYKLGANAVLCKNESPQEFKGIMSELAKV